MSKQIYITLPVRDVEKAKTFYTALGYAIDPKFSGDNAACIVIGENICLMLSGHDFFKQLANKDVCDTSTHMQALFALVADSREQVDELLGKVLAAGGREAHEPEEYGFMYQRAFHDLDGHGFAVNCMTPQSEEN
ncbi:MAG: glyoxalase/bleomycin resistance/extradiol dioxygenase family protein [Lysobacteraceae bacterium]